MSRRDVRAYIILVAPVVTGIAWAVGEYRRAEPASPNWPSDASQLLATLLVVLVLEQRVLRRDNLIFFVFVLWAGMALAVSVDNAASGQAYERFDNAFVAGALLMLVTAIILVATTTDSDDREERNEHSAPGDR